MAKETATTKETSGAGFGFEDKVAAHFATWLLLGGTPFFPRAGTIEKIEFQKRVDKYHLDDLVLTLNSGEMQWECSLSVKSNTQFTAKAAPAPFVHALWEMYLHVGTDRFVRGRDCMGLATEAISERVQTTLLRDLLPKALHQESQVLARRLTTTDPDAESYVSDDVRSLFRSFGCPTSLSGQDPLDHAATADLLKHVIVIGFDFGAEPSANEAQTVQILSRMLRSSTDASARALWHDLLGIVRRENEAGGYLDRTKLISEFRGRHELSELPDFSADWQKVTEWGRESLAGINEAIGGSLRLPRERIVEEIRGGLETVKICGVIGPSGTGKSVLTKLAASSTAGASPVLWFDAPELTSPNFMSLRSRLGLAHSLSEIFSNLANQSGIVVIDGLERLSTEQDHAQLRRLVTALGIGLPTTPWLLVFSCQSERWEYVQAKLISLGIDPTSLHLIQVPALRFDELQIVQQKFPNLGQIIFRPHLRALLSRPKVLDILAAHAVQLRSADPNAWAGESDFIQWYWASVIGASDAGAARSALLQILAERQADHGESETPLVEVQAAPLDALPGLQRDGVCHRTSQERVSFDHDLIADWSRQRVLLSREAKLHEYLIERALNPNWHKAIRLYGLHLIEGEGGVEAWASAMGRLPTARDLFLDSIVLAANPHEPLQKLWPTLIAADGVLLRRLLRRFLHVATYPDPIAVSIGARDKDLGGWLRATIRRPLWPHWVGVIRFVHAHANEVVKLVPLEVAQLAETWLVRGHPDWILRREAAELALAVGEATWQERLAHPYRRDEDDEKRYQAALAASSELPDQVADFALRACARKLTAELESGRIGEYVAPGTMVEVRSLGYSVKRPQPPPWVHGPKYRIDSAFQQCSLFKGALLPLMSTRPATAVEVILATIIEHRIPERPDHASRSFNDDVELDYLPQFSPPLYDRGPFISFLRAAPVEAITCIVHLVDFAATRWIESHKRSNDETEIFSILSGSGSKTFRGGAQICGWYRGAFAPASVTSALMALEHWMYHLIEQGEAIDAACSLIFERAESCAFLGLLWEVGRFKPDLFDGPLRSLLSCAALYWWEIRALVEGLDRLGLIGVGLQPEKTRQKHIEWERKPHRTVNVQDFALKRFLFDNSTSEFFAKATEVWRKQKDEQPADPLFVNFLEGLIARFNLENWEDFVDERGSAGRKYKPTAAQEDKTTQAAAALQEVAPFHQIVQIRRVLDGELSLEPTRLVEFYENLRGVAGRKSDHKGEDRRRIAAILGSIAALAARHWTWLAEDASRREWCRRTLLQILAHPPDQGELASEHDKSKLSWEDFAAQALVPFWARDPSSRELRHAVAEAVMARHYSAVGLLVHAAFTHRKALGDEFNRLIAFVLAWGVVRDDLNWAERRSDPPDVAAWFSVHGEAFIAGTSTASWSGWAEQAIQNGRRFEVGAPHSVVSSMPVKKRFAVHPHIDQLLISSAFGETLRVTHAESEAERHRWITFWRDALKCFAAAHDVREPNGDRVTDGDSEVHELYDSDRWLARRLSQLILDLTPTEKREEIWQTIIDLGPPAHEWIESFLVEWLIYGLQLGDSTGFAATWKAMFEYAARSAIWSDEKRAWPHWDDFWLHMLGIDRHIAFVWFEDYKPVVQQMIGCFEQWVPQHLSDRLIARTFLSWLRHPAAQPLRTAAVPWLLAAARSADEYWWDRGEMTDAVAEVLNKVWNEEANAITASPVLQRNFRELVALVARRQHPLAMDLQERMTASAP